MASYCMLSGRTIWCVHNWSDCGSAVQCHAIMQNNLSIPSSLLVYDVWAIHVSSRIYSRSSYGSIMSSICGTYDNNRAVILLERALCTFQVVRMVPPLQSGETRNTNSSLAIACTIGSLLLLSNHQHLAHSS